jgi:hypothetical protein
MITPISSTHAIDVREVTKQPAEVRPDPQRQTPPVQKSGTLSHDQVTLRSAGQPDDDSDRR